MNAGFVISRRLFAVATISLLIVFMANAVCGASEVNALKVLRITISPHNPHVIYITTLLGDSYKSTDGGSSWVSQYGFMEERKLSRPVFDRDNPSVVYAAAEGRNNDVFIKSADGGESWDLVFDGVWRKTSEFSEDDLEFLEFECGGINRIFGDPQNSSTLYLGTTRGICKSIDGGLHWELNKLMNGSYYESVARLVIYPKNTSIIYAGTHSGNYKSIDAGESWTAKSDRTETEKVSVYGLEIDPNNSEIVYGIGSPDSHLYKSVDSTTSWQRLNIPSLRHSRWEERASVTTVVVADNSSVYAIARFESIDRLYKSVDGGSSWQHLNIPSFRNKNEEAKINTMVISDDNSVIYAGARDGVYRSVDGGRSWQAPEFVPREMSTEIIAIDPTNPKTVYSGGSGGMHKSTDGGRTWRAINEGLPQGHW